MTSLPRPLAPWARELAMFGGDARTVLGPWLPRLERLMGPHAEQADATGEPDGFSGLGRRGRYERLALSQWGLLDVAPDEFLRRAGSAEHLFHEIARTSRAAGRRLVALFDAGPAQLGAPRLVHLAWMVLLGRRCQRRGVAFEWGVLQAPDGGLRAGCDQAAVRALLAARSPYPVAQIALTRWQELLGPPADGEERWVVGADHQRALSEALSAASLAVAESDDPGERVLRVSTISRAATRGTATLPLPTPLRCARLLLDPFASDMMPAEGRPGDSLVAPGAQVVFAGTGDHVIARLVSGEVVALAVPTRPGPYVEKPLVRFSPRADNTVIAAGWAKGSLYVATWGIDDGPMLHVSRGRQWIAPALTVRANQVPVPRGSPETLGALVVDRSSSFFLFQDTGGRIYEGRLGGGRLSLLHEQALGCAWAPRCLTTVARSGSGAVEIFRHDRRAIQRRVIFEGMAHAREGFVALDGRGQANAVAVTEGGGIWHMADLRSGERQELHLPAATAVFGVATNVRRAFLLARDATDRLVLLDHERDWRRFPMPGEVEHACVHSRGHLIAAQVNGGLVVVDRDAQVRLRWGGRA